MGIIVKGVEAGFLVAVFVSLYAEGLFGYILPLPIIYGILAPLFAAIAIFIMMLSKKDETRMRWTEEGEKSEE